MREIKQDQPVFKQFVSTVLKGIDEDRRIVEFTISTSSKDREASSFGGARLAVATDR
jgi:hypothetical protein